MSAGSRSLMTYVPLPGDGRPHTVTLIPGDGIGPEVTEAVTEVVEALGAPIIWERCARQAVQHPRSSAVRAKVALNGSKHDPLEIPKYPSNQRTCAKGKRGCKACKVRCGVRVYAGASHGKCLLGKKCWVLNVGDGPLKTTDCVATPQSGRLSSGLSLAS